MNENRVAIVAEGRSYSYGDLDVASRCVAAALLEGRDDLGQMRVAFLVRPGFDYVAVQRGVWRAGGVAVPLAASHPPPELEYVIRDSGAVVVVGEPASAPVLAPIASAAGVRFMTTVQLLEHPGESALPHLGATRPAMIIYTSGTTARPKGVVTTHANIGAQIAALVEAWEWSPSDRLLLALPLHHVHGIINGLGSALAVAATCEMLSAFDAGAVWSRLGSGDITVFTAVPTMYRRLITSWEAASEADQRVWSEGARRTQTDDVGFCGVAGADSRALEGDHGAHVARALRHDRDRDGAGESVAGRTPTRGGWRTAAGRRGSARR